MRSASAAGCLLLSVLALPAATPVARADEAPSVRQEIFRRMSEGRTALEAGDARTAAENLCWASRRALNSHDAAWFCGKARLLARDPEGAVTALRLATEIDPQHLGSWIDFGDALLAAGRPDEARAPFYKALDLKKDYSAAWDGLARLAQRTGKTDEALGLFAKALEANPADARARLHRGQLHQEAGRLDQAIADVSEAARLRPDDAEIQLGLARTLLRARRLDESLAATRRAGALLPKDPRITSLQAEIYLALDALNEAEEAARLALIRDPGDGRARLVLGEVQGRRGRLEDALATLLVPPGLNVDELDAAALGEARQRWQQRLTDRQRLETVAAAPDAPAAALLDLASIRLATGEREAAATLAERAAPLVTEAAERRRVALVLARAGRPTAAEPLLAALAQDQAAAPSDLVNLGVVRELTGDGDGAGQAYDAALQRAAGAAGDRASAAEAHAGRARLALARGDRAAAAKALEAYLANGPAPEFATRAKEALARLGGDANAAVSGASRPGAKK